MNEEGILDVALPQETFKLALSLSLRVIVGCTDAPQILIDLDEFLFPYFVFEAHSERLYAQADVVGALIMRQASHFHLT